MYGRKGVSQSLPGVLISDCACTCVLCAGLHLQDYSTRKVLERTVKGITHDKAAISVAPPKAYARRFLEFVTHR